MKYIFKRKVFKWISLNPSTLLPVYLNDKVCMLKNFDRFDFLVIGEKDYIQSVIFAGLLTSVEGNRILPIFKVTQIFFSILNMSPSVCVGRNVTLIAHRI
jgi:hypothetical protein